MLKKKKTSRQFFVILAVIATIILVLIFLLIIPPQQKKVEQVNQEIVEYGSTSYITPTIYPTDNTNMIFIHPQKHFSFEYPKEWQLELTQRNVREPFYQVFLTDNLKEKNFRIHFSTNGRDYPDYQEAVDYKNLGGRDVKWVTLYNNDTAVEVFTQFPNNDFGNNLIGLYIYLPQEKQAEFIKQVEEIIASLK